jgi:hypothetical protein
MAETPEGTPVGVEDPYEHAGPCDFLADDGRCRYAAEHAERDPAFARERRADGLRCLALPESGDGRDPEWRACPHFRSTTDGRACVRCGLEERRDAHSDAGPLVEEHHLSYPEGELSHEITVALCRWCHAKVHGSWATLADDVGPDPEALAAAAERRSAELAEGAFRTAADRREGGDG